MSTISIPIFDKIINAIDSDDVQVLALSVEANLPKEATGKLKIMLKVLLKENKLNTDEADTVRQFLSFMQ
ncbi:MAG: hypothetical protein Q8L90_13415 [Bacteroidota bacterium]|nr:hypothetical protein [Bacteroidota bacterium]